MKKRKIIILSSTILLLAMGISVIAYTNTDKTNILENDISSAIKNEEDQIKAKIEEGKGFIDSKDFNKAKEAFEEAIAKEKGNRETYERIKEIYIEANRFDDAYYFVDLAILNNVDSEYFTQVLKDIESNIIITTVKEHTYVGYEYTPPKTAEVEINGEKFIKDVKWVNYNLPSTVGKVTFEGEIVGVKKGVNLELDVRSGYASKEEILEKLVGEYEENTSKNNDVKYTIKFFANLIVNGEEYYSYLINSTHIPSGTSVTLEPIIAIALKTGGKFHYYPDYKLMTLDGKEVGELDAIKKYYKNREELSLLEATKLTMWRINNDSSTSISVYTDFVDEGYIYYGNYGYLALEKKEVKKAEVVSSNIEIGDEDKALWVKSKEKNSGEIAEFIVVLTKDNLNIRLYKKVENSFDYIFTGEFNGVTYRYK